MLCNELISFSKAPEFSTTSKVRTRWERRHWDLGGKEGGKEGVGEMGFATDAAGGGVWGLVFSFDSPKSVVDSSLGSIEITDSLSDSDVDDQSSESSLDQPKLSSSQVRSEFELDEDPCIEESEIGRGMWRVVQSAELW